MNIAILGSGSVGQTIGKKLVQSGHHVTLGSRTANNPEGAKWRDALGQGAAAAIGTFADAARTAELVFNCTGGQHSLAAIEAAGADNFANKLLIDVANPLDFSRGFPPSLTICNTDSLGEQIQRALPATRVVKALNTVNSDIMVDASLVPGEHNLFLCGNDAAAKQQVAGYLSQWFGWPAAAILDLGDISAARATEMYLPLWLRLMGSAGHPHFNIRLVRGAA